MREAKFSDVLKQYKIYHFVDDNTEYRQVTISRHTGVSYRGTKFGRDIGRKRQFVIDLEQYSNTFIFTRQGVQDGSYGMVPKDVHNCVVTENMPMFSVEPELNPQYLEYYLQTPHFQDQLQALNASGSAQKSIHEDTFLELNILLPNIDKQIEIVNEIHGIETKKEKVSLELKTQSDLIAKLRASILSDAVSGRLVPQDPTDEPASLLLEKIRAEKERLIKEGKIKREKPLSPIADDEIPYELPDGWVWCRLRDVCKYITDGEHQTPPRISQGKKLLSAKNVRDGFLDYDNCDYISQEHYEKARNRCLPEIGDLLIVSVGGTIGRTSLIKENSDFALVRSVALIKPLLIVPEYLRIVLNSKLLQDMINLTKRGGAQPCLYLNSINQFLFPLPSIIEQHRIVSKVEELMATCAELEAEVAKSCTETDRLMQTILKEAFENKKAGTE